MKIGANLAACPGNRIGNRLRLGLPATLVLTHESRPCLLQDVSASGAHVSLEASLPVNGVVILSFHELRQHATVVWSDDGECGLRFTAPLPLEDMQGFLWIKQNPKIYERICREKDAHMWQALRDD